MTARCDKCARDVRPNARRTAWEDVTTLDTAILGSGEVCPAYAPEVNRLMTHTVNGERVPAELGHCLYCGIDLALDPGHSEATCPECEPES